MLGLRLDLQARKGDVAAAFIAQAVTAVGQGIKGAVDAGQVGGVDVGQGLVYLAGHIALHYSPLVGAGGREVLAVLLHLGMQLVAACQQQGPEFFFLGGGQCGGHGVLLDFWWLRELAQRTVVVRWPGLCHRNAWGLRYPANTSFPAVFAMSLDLSRIRAITLDLDDTLWPIWPTIARAEVVLQNWLGAHAPATQALCQQPGVLRAIREQVHHECPDLLHDMSALRRESIRRALLRAGDDPALAQDAFEAFFAERQRVELFADALPALEYLSSRFPVVALSNGNADVQRVGLGRYFYASVSAREVGVAKPDVRIFQHGAQAAGVPTQQVLHIGDDAHLDGVGGLQAGMQVAWLNRAGHDWAHAPHTPHLTVADLGALCACLAQGG